MANPMTDMFKLMSDKKLMEDIGKAFVKMNEMPVLLKSIEKNLEPLNRIEHKLDDVNIRLATLQQSFTDLELLIMEDHFKIREIQGMRI